MSERGGVWLVIPAWQEADAIGAVLDEVPPDLVDEIIVVVGSSTDPTADVAAAHGARVVAQRKPGYGAACWTGAELALHNNATVVAFLDGDYADPPADLSRIVGPVLRNEADLVLGCRNLDRSPEALPLHARLGNALICGVLRALLHADFRDVPSYKAIGANALRQLGMQEMTYGWTVEMLAKAARQRLRVQQVEVAYRPRRGGRSKVAGNPRASLRAAYKLLTCAFAYATRPDWSTMHGN